jgi:hypothetical protein
MFFFWVFELGIMSIRWSMLDRGLDLTVRSLRLNHYSDDLDGLTNAQAHDFLRTEICGHSSVLKECDELLYLEMTVLTAGQTIPSDKAACVNRDAPVNTRPNVNTGGRVVQNPQEIVYVRACYWIDPIMPFGLRLLGISSEKKPGSGPVENKAYEQGFAITSKTIYINEPT